MDLPLKSTLSPEECLVLKALLIKAQDGYCLMAKTGISKDNFEITLGELIKKELVKSYNGDDIKHSVSSYYLILPNVRARVELLLELVD